MMDTTRPDSLTPAPHPWLTGIPANWRSGPLKRFITSMDSGVSVNAFDIPAEAGQLGVLKTSCVYSGRFDASQNKTVVEHERDLVACPVRVGALIVSRMNTPDLVGAAGLVQEAAPNLFLPDRLWQVTFHGLLPRFAHYWTQSGLYRASVNAACAGTSASMQNLSQDDFRGFPLAAPDWQTQVLLADFLDSETARIDALIEKKTHFIELLREKRQALITQAVARGLDPGAPMKDSGVKWLGLVPAHWTLKPLKLLVKPGSSVTYGIVQPGDSLDEGIPFVQTTNISRGDFDLNNLQRTTPEIEAMYPRSRLNGGEVILGIRASIGAAFVVPEHLKGANLSRGIARIDCNAMLTPSYLMQYLRSQAAAAYWELSRQGSTFNEVSIETVRGLPVLVPPLAEQAAITDFLAQSTTRINRLTAASVRSKHLLSERRAALITAAVTGQIDVREAA